MNTQIATVTFDFIKYVLSLILVFIVLPRFIFIYDKKDFSKGLVTNFIKMTFWTIAIGYLLVFLKIYELITIIFIIFLGILYRFYKNKILYGNIRKELNDEIQLIIFDHTDNQERIQDKIYNYLYEKVSYISEVISSYLGNPLSFLNTVIMLSVFIYSAYLRLYDAFVNAAPPLSDSYVTLSWMKYIEQRILFHDNIYPQGFHIFLATIHKFASIDHLYVLKFAGPINGLLIVIGMYFFVSKTTANKSAGILAAIIYGWLGNYFMEEWSRQAATNSQEFAFLFIWPTLYFFFEFINNSKKDDFVLALFGASIIGLVHSLAFMFLVASLVVLCLVAILRSFLHNFVKSLEVLVIVITSLVISLIPIGIGLLMGKGFHSASEQFLTARASVFQIPPLNFIDYLAIIALGLLFLHSLFMIKNKKRFILEMWISLFGFLMVFIYQYASAILKSQMLISRSNTLWALIIPVAIGFGAFIIFEVFSFIFRFKTVKNISLIIIIIVAIITLKPMPIMPYKMEHNSSVAQYIKINKSFRPTQWMIVSQEEGYALTLSNGWHLMVKDFIDWYNPEGEKLINKNNFEKLVTEDIFIFYEKNIFYETNKKLPSEVKTITKRRKIENPQLLEWIQKYSATHSNITLYFEDENIQVWHIHQELDKEEKKDQIWKG